MTTEKMKSALSSFSTTMSTPSDNEIVNEAIFWHLLLLSSWSSLKFQLTQKNKMMRFNNSGEEPF